MSDNQALALIGLIYLIGVIDVVALFLYIDRRS